VAQQRIGMTMGLWGVHLIMLVILAALFTRRLTLFSVARLIRSK
jgi:hypothetical protein